MDALINRLTAELNDTSGPSLGVLGTQARQALRFDVGDARLYSVIGEIEFRQGNKDQAYRLFDRARKLSKTEIHALQRSIDRSIETGNLTAAVDEIDILLRRWPDRFSVVADGFPTILADPEGYAAVMKALAVEAPWRSSLFLRLARDLPGLSVADQILLDLRGTAAPPTAGELSAVINGYFRQKAFQQAYRLFLFSLSDEQQKLKGYVFNGEFEPIYSRQPFDWQVVDQSGMEVIFAGSKDAVEGESGATIRFLNSPIKNIALQQYMELPPGSYNLSLLASGRNIKLPKGMFWSVRCVGQPDEAVRLDIPEGTFNRQKINSSFTIDPSCPLQIVRLETASIVESWRFRYVGSLVMHKLSIERIPS